MDSPASSVLSANSSDALAASPDWLMNLPFASCHLPFASWYSPILSATCDTLSAALDALPLSSSAPAAALENADSTAPISPAEKSLNPSNAPSMAFPRFAAWLLTEFIAPPARLAKAVGAFERKVLSISLPTLVNCEAAVRDAFTIFCIPGLTSSTSAMRIDTSLKPSPPTSF